MPQRWNHRVDCFLGGIVVGLLSTSPFALFDANHTMMFVGLFAAFTTLSKVTSEAPPSTARKRGRAALQASGYLMTGVLATLAGWLIGSEF